MVAWWQRAVLHGFALCSASCGAPSGPARSRLPRAPLRSAPGLEGCPGIGAPATPGVGARCRVSVCAAAGCGLAAPCGRSRSRQAAAPWVGRGTMDWWRQPSWSAQSVGRSGRVGRVRLANSIFLASGPELFCARRADDTRGRTPVGVRPRPGAGRPAATDRLVRWHANDTLSGHRQMHSIPADARCEVRSPGCGGLRPGCGPQPLVRCSKRSAPRARAAVVRREAGHAAADRGRWLGTGQCAGWGAAQLGLDASCGRLGRQPA